MPDLTVQTRSISGELRYYKTVVEALTFAKENEGVWKQCCYWRKGALSA